MRLLASGITLSVLLILAGGQPKGYAAESSVPAAFAGNNSPVINAAIQYTVPQKSRNSRPKKLPERHSLIIDSQIRQIGGNSWGKNSAQGRPPLQKYIFTADKLSKVGYSTLVIGNIKGLNTPEAHQTGSSQVSFVSSPTVIKLNGHTVGYIYAEGNNLNVPVPNQYLRVSGYNIVQVEAGFYFSGENDLAYDQIEFQNVSLEY